MQHNSRSATEQKIGKGGSIGKRKVSDQEEALSSSSSSQPQHHQQQDQPHRSSPSPVPHQQQTISELLARNQNPGRNHLQQLSPTTKRARLSASPSESSSAATRSQGVRSPGSMYNFSNTDSGAGSGALGKPRPFNATPRQNNFTPHTGAKKLVVKNLRKPRLDQDSYFEKAWGQLDAALGAVFSGGKPETSLEELYKGAENVCRQGNAAILSKKLQDRCRENVSGKLRETLVAKAEGGSNIEMLRAVVDTWATWQSELVCFDPIEREREVFINMALDHSSLDVLLSGPILPPPLKGISCHS